MGKGIWRNGGDLITIQGQVNICSRKIERSGRNSRDKLELKSILTEAAVGKLKAHEGTVVILLESK